MIRRDYAKALKERLHAMDAEWRAAEEEAMQARIDARLPKGVESRHRVNTILEYAFETLPKWERSSNHRFSHFGICTTAYDCIIPKSIHGQKTPLRDSQAEFGFTTAEDSVDKMLAEIGFGLYETLPRYDDLLGDVRHIVSSPTHMYLGLIIFHSKGRSYSGIYYPTSKRLRESLSCDFSAI